MLKSDVPTAIPDSSGIPLYRTEAAAGFGNENFGSVVKIPLFAIFQIVVEESILYLNSVATVEKFNKITKRSSFDVFKNNPNNKKFDNN